MSRVREKILLLIFIATCSCVKKKATDYLVYEDEVSGLTMQYPSSWSIMTDDDLAKIKKGTLRLYEESSGKKGVIHARLLLCVKKDDSNYFISGTQPAERPTNDSIYYESLTLLKKRISNFDYKIQTVQIDNTPFRVIDVSFYSNDNKKPVNHQVLYDRLENKDEYFTFNIKYNNDVDKASLQHIIKSIKFKSVD